MGLLSGGLNGRRFRITTELPGDFRDQFKEALIENAMQTDLDASDDEPRVGWVTPFEHANTSFELNDFLFDRFLLVTMRIDKKSINGRFFKIALAEKLAQICDERGVEKLSKADKEMISEALSSELYRRQLPSVSTVDVCWDVTTGEVIVFNTSDNTIDMVRNAMQETFDVVIRPERMADWLTAKFDRAEVVERTERYLPDARGGQGTGEVVDGYHHDDILEGCEQELAVDFIRWLWRQAEASDGHFRVIDEVQNAVHDRLDDVDDMWNDITETLKHADLTLWLEGKLKLVRLGDDEASETTTIVGEAPTTSTAARMDVASGKVPVEATLGMKLDELECKMTLSVGANGLNISGLKLPFEVKKGTDEKVFERMMLLDLVHTTTKQLFQQFFLARTSDAWFDRMNTWVEHELAAK